jgi:hypothetical protein
LISCFADL